MIEFFLWGTYRMLDKVSTPWIVVIILCVPFLLCLWLITKVNQAFLAKAGRFYDKPVEMVLNYLKGAMVPGSVTVLRSPEAKSGTVQTMNVTGIPRECGGPTCPKQAHYLLVNDGNLLVDWKRNFNVEGVMALQHRGVIAHYANFSSEYVMRTPPPGY